MVSQIPSSDCSLEDTDCICRDEQLSSLVAGCMLANCTMQDSLQTARVQAVLCDLPNDSKRSDVFTYTGIVYSVAFSFVALRTAGKLVSKGLALDDYMVIFAILLSALPVACALASTFLQAQPLGCNSTNDFQ